MRLTVIVRSWILPTLISVVAFGAVEEFNDGPKKQETPAEKYQSLLKEYQAADEEFEKAGEAAKTDEDVAKLRQMQEKLRQFPTRFLDLAQNNSADPVAIDALAWIIFNNSPRFPVVNDAVELLIRDHIASEKFGVLLPTMWGMSGPPIEKLFRAALEQSPKRDVKGLACFSLAKYCKINSERGQLTASLQKSPSGLSFPLDFQKLGKESASLFERVIEEFGDVKYYSTTLADVAEAELFQLANLAIGNVAQEIEGEDIEGLPFKLSDYRGKVAVLDFWGST